MITLRLTEHANIFLNTYAIVVFSHLSLEPLFPCTRSQQCFGATATIRSFGHFEHLELSLSLYCDVAFTHCEQQISWKFWTNQRVLTVVVITKKNCLRMFAASMWVISAMTGNPYLMRISILKLSTSVFYHDRKAGLREEKARNLFQLKSVQSYSLPWFWLQISFVENGCEWFVLWQEIRLKC